MTQAIEMLASKLSGVSSDLARDPYADIQWPAALPADAWCMPPELISLHQTPAYELLDTPAQLRLSRLELILFFSLNVHGESRLITGLGTSLAANPPVPVAEYLEHFRDEEAKHRACFIEFCERYGNGIHGDRNFDLALEWPAAESQFVFFARVLLFEGLVDQINGIIARDERVAMVVRQINRAHRVEEARHLAFGRAWLALLARPLIDQHSGRVPDPIIQHLCAYRQSIWRDLFDPDVYRDAGIVEPFAARREALASESANTRREQLFCATDDFFVRIGCPLRDTWK